MAKQFNEITDDHRTFIEAQHLFFCGTAAQDGRVNISPKGMDSLRILGPNRIVWRNFTGSGNETAGHLAQINRITLMWCGFEKRPMILRVYGSARILHPRDADFETLGALFAPALGARQLFDVQIEMVQSSCGYAIPFFDYSGERDVLTQWNDTKGQSGIERYWDERNRTTIDGMPTHILPEDKDA
ncbi:pyridoxamine 5'-phosphate oxidase family protein [Sulfitobacter sp. F26169L]|uniref:pyridoxamine 5'-phosphate oxidase family protein n=1 Tax=Sulfitobacter sp. F26169L TaxID=2996015 RepID=UPI002260C37C|nr:pyridoxamine 5'-phosphate oxidase family protein [Sulfitobacter sp. F26169L]MCX7566275.1 pyridoxamine 5'-phosphate oxidase family protein [Sulfitobacter sp. F26169L]